MKTAGHDVLQVIVASVHPGPPLPLQQRLGDLLVLVGLGHGRTVRVGTAGPQHRKTLLAHFILL